MNSIIKKAKLLAFSAGAAWKKKTSIRDFSAFGLAPVFGHSFEKHPDELHLEHAVRWLSSAQDSCGKGVSAAYCLKNGWMTEYPETSGYIISTFLAYSVIYKNDDLRKRAIRIGNWEIEIQSPDGGIFSDMNRKNTRIFNTGQVILGWCDLYEKTGDRSYLDAALKAGNYLISSQEPNGTWQKNTYCGAKTYHARTDWGLLRLADLSGERKYADSAMKNIKWVLESQTENGWFGNCGFYSADPITHLIAYSLRGLLEADALLRKNKIDLLIQERIRKAAYALCDICDKKSINGIKGLIPASFDLNWNSKDKYSCVTGNMQTAVFLYRLAQTGADSKFISSADTLIDAAARTQFTNYEITGITGGIPGSWPIYGAYMPYSFPDWAAKFFADAIMMKLNWEKGLSVNA